MEDAKIAAVDRLKKANNVLVTVSTNPSVDQLAGAIGLTLLLNKLGKHATAVFSGEIPSTIEFLQPEKTLEQNTDSLRDFIISLDKSKADKLRYKVEEKLVKVFITPYKTSIGQEDLEFSQGDFNVDVVVTLGVHEQIDIDAAITAHGRILHDASIISVNTEPNGNLGSINWVDARASSLCEMLGELGLALKNDVFDGQMATALLTGIVAETKRFSNDKTTALTMSLSAKLMAAGANQQLVASKLQEVPKPVIPEAVAEESNDNDNDDNDDGALKITHDDIEELHGEDTGEEPTLDTAQVHIDEQGILSQGGQPDNNPSESANSLASQNIPKAPSVPELPNEPETSKLILEPPSMSGGLTGNTLLQSPSPDADPLSLPNVTMPLLSHDSGRTPKPDEEPVLDNTSLEKALSQMSDKPTIQETAPKIPEPLIDNDQTLSDIEQAVDSPHVDVPPDQEPDLNSARDAVTQAVSQGESVLEPIAALGAQPVNLDMGHEDVANSPRQASEDIKPTNYLDITSVNEKTGLPAGQMAPGDQVDPTVENPNAPPPVPPPMMPPQSMQYDSRPLPDQSNHQSPEPLSPL